MWRAVDAQGRRGAVKLLALPAADAPAAAHEQLRRFEQEAAIASRLDHAHIVAHWGHGRDHGFSWQAMECMEGGDLAAALLRSGGRLDAASAMDLAQAVLQALAHAHERGVLHRDLKPSNILLGDRGAGDWRIGDFGAGRAEDSAATRSGVSVGTPAYMAPEALAGLDAGARGDLYALGVLLYEALAGRLPFEGATLGALLRSVASGRVLPLAEAAPGVPPALAACVHALMHRDPVLRPASARAALRSLVPSVPAP